MLVQAARQYGKPLRRSSWTYARWARSSLVSVQYRWHATTTSPSRVTAIPGQNSTTYLSRESTRSLATATEYAQLPPTHWPLYSNSQTHTRFQQAHGQPELQQWDPSKLILLSHTALQPPPQLLHVGGIGGTPVALFQNLHACLQVGRRERAANIVKRIAEIYEANAPESLEAYNIYVKDLVEELESLDPSLRGEKEIIGVQKWFERDLKPFVKPNGDTYALMCRASLAGQTGLRRDRTIRRYLAMATNDSVYDETLDSQELNEEEADALERIYSGHSANGLQIGLPSSVGTTQRSTMSHHMFGTGRDVQVKSVSQKGDGLSTLISSLTHLDNLSSVPFPHQLDLSTKEKEKYWAKARQEAIEKSVGEAAISSWRRAKENMLKMGIAPGLQSKSMNIMLWDWHEKLEILIAKEIEASRAIPNTVAKASKHAQQALLAPYLERLPAQQLSVMTIVTVMKLMATTTKDREMGLKLISATTKLGRVLEAECQFADQEKAKANPRSTERDQRTRNTSSTQTTPLHTTDNSSVNSTSEEQDLWSRHSMSNKTGWPPEVKVSLAALLISKLLEVAKVSVPASDGSLEKTLEPALAHKHVYLKGSKIGVLVLHDSIQTKLKREPIASLLGGELPMVTEPKPWTSFRDGGYLLCPTDVVRTKSGFETQRLYLSAADEKGHLDQVYQSLNVLGAVPWRVNQDVFRVMLEAWNSGEAVANLAPENPDLPLPPQPEASSGWAERVKWAKKAKEVKNERMGLHSQRCFQNFQMEIARAYLDETFYCPHNVDFRGRVYPIPPHFNHIGADNVRGLLIFADGKKLGKDGLKWLKIHLANVFGYDKASLQEREDFVTNHLVEIRDSVLNPYKGSRWWLKAEDPWQCLAACFELVNALDSPNPEEFISHVPVQQDGTCNGLQHYAALGGDVFGAQHVNLVPGDRPADIYTAIAELVKTSVNKDAEAQHPLAMKLSGKITRKVVKQTVMTNVYGVTFIGAKDQVLKQLNDILTAEEPDPQLSNEFLARYIAKKIFAALDTMFTGAQAIQRWLGQCADRISNAITPEQLESIVKRKGGSREDYGPRISTKNRVFVQKRSPKNSKLTDEFRSAVVWTTPLKMPVVQPYQNTHFKQVKTPMQALLLSEPRINDPVSKRKQLQGFPPNFIHSLDATHMMLSSIRCHEEGLTFSSVHDSFWTHACDVPAMSQILREAFIRMHSEDIIGRLLSEFQARYKGSIYMTYVDTKTPLGQAIKNWRTKVGRKNYRTPNVEAGMEELLEEHKRQKLLRSSDPVQRKKGEEMETPASIFEKFQSESPVDEQESLAEALESDVSSSDAEPGRTLSAPGVEHSHDSASVTEEAPLGQETVKRAAPLNRRVCVWLPLTFPKVPPKGDFDVSRLQSSTYFFS